MPENPRIYGLSGYFIGCDNLVMEIRHREIKTAQDLTRS